MKGYIIVLTILLLVGFTYWYIKAPQTTDKNIEANSITILETSDIPTLPDNTTISTTSSDQIRLPRNADEFSTNWQKSSIELANILLGGPLKDGIPALTRPEMIPLSRTRTDQDTLGILVDFESEQRWYGYDVLLYHEIVNDTIGDTHFAVTYCPLCDSAIVFDRKYDDIIHEFGVTGWLYESNMLMYDKATESMWSQAMAQAVVGEYTGTLLRILPMQLLTLSQAKNLYPDVSILSRETGFEDRLYGYNPYGNYATREEIIYPISRNDDRLPAKTIMMVIPRNDDALAIPLLTIPEGTSSYLFSKENAESSQQETLILTRNNGKVSASINSISYPHYISMWFSFALHHFENGILIQPNIDDAMFSGV